MLVDARGNVRRLSVLVGGPRHVPHLPAISDTLLNRRTLLCIESEDWYTPRPHSYLILFMIPNITPLTLEKSEVHPPPQTHTHGAWSLSRTEPIGDWRPLNAFTPSSLFTTCTLTLNLLDHPYERPPAQTTYNGQISKATNQRIPRYTLLHTTTRTHRTDCRS